jgi:hypothetical protein
MTDRYIQWYLTGTGYHVTVYGPDNQPIYEYDAGNHPLDSQSVSTLHPLPDETLIRYAEQTSRETAEEYGISYDRISRDTDSEDPRWQ